MTKTIKLGDKKNSPPTNEEIKRQMASQAQMRAAQQVQQERMQRLVILQSCLKEANVFHQNAGFRKVLLLEELDELFETAEYLANRIIKGDFLNYERNENKTPDIKKN